VLVDVALVGFGNVARRFVRLLDERQALLNDRYDLTCRITGIATRRHGAVYDADGVDALRAARTIEAGDTLAAEATGIPV
jgi:homoserine dehydrogenase